METSFSPLITFVLEEPDGTLNGIHTAACRGQSKYLLGEQRDGCFIGFEGGTQRAGSRADHTPSLSEELVGAGALWELEDFLSLALAPGRGPRYPTMGTGTF